MNNFSGNESRLRLRAKESEDLTVISACLQGAVTCYGEIAYDKAEERFAAIMVRYTWEDAASHKFDKDVLPLKQVRAALRIEGVHKILLKKVDQTKENRLLELIAISALKVRDKNRIRLIFSCGGEILVDVAGFDIRMEDLDEPVQSNLMVTFDGDEPID